MEAVETHPYAPEFRNYLRPVAVVPLEEAPPPLEEDPSD